MKRLLVMLVLATLMLTACGSSENENKKDEVVVKSTSVKTIDKENQGKNYKENKKENKKDDSKEIKMEKEDTTKENSEKNMAEEGKENEEILEEYIDLLKENPIGLDYSVEYEILNEPGNYTDKAVGEFNRKYFDIWDAELNAIYNKLLEVLRDEEKELLIESQKGWLKFHLNDPEFAFKTFRERETG